MSAAVTDLLERLVDATPTPPEHDDPERVLAAFDAMVSIRATLLHALEAAVPIGLTVSDRTLADELERRDKAWIAALGLARQTVSDRLIAVRRAQRRM